MNPPVTSVSLQQQEVNSSSVPVLPSPYSFRIPIQANIAVSVQQGRVFVCLEMIDEALHSAASRDLMYIHGKLFDPDTGNGKVVKCCSVCDEVQFMDQLQQFVRFTV